MTKHIASTEVEPGMVILAMVTPRQSMRHTVKAVSQSIRTGVVSLDCGRLTVKIPADRYAIVVI